METATSPYHRRCAMSGNGSPGGSNMGIGEESLEVVLVCGLHRRRLEVVNVRSDQVVGLVAEYLRHGRIREDNAADRSTTKTTSGDRVEERLIPAQRAFRSHG